ncbi:MAG: 50S ribosomal protein L13 [Candidatus Heimdallarchaeaceae archaeon]|jgi:large subunit ribosomal protein L13|nr:50S ribosomal protein L13 [Candidatus Heimdallarchaeota archaeon]MCK4254226.1 50S ribosomal protein L13 [Candidatus Heimdallarchaeota archaeon]
MVKTGKNVVTQLVTPKIIIDADNAILGRLCSEVAKYLLDGYAVNIVNCENAIISGKKHSILNEYRNMHKIHTATNPRRGPFHPKRPDRLVRRTVRGMLPWKKSKGRNAYHRLLTYIGIPDEFSNLEIIKPKYADANKLDCKKTTVGNLCKEFGWQE